MFCVLFQAQYENGTHVNDCTRGDFFCREYATACTHTRQLSIHVDIYAWQMGVRAKPGATFRGIAYYDHVCAPLERDDGLLRRVFHFENTSVWILDVVAEG